MDSLMGLVVMVVQLFVLYMILSVVGNTRKQGREDTADSARIHQ